MHHLFFELLQISLGNRKRFSRIPTPAEWEQLLLLSEKQAIDGVMTDGLERLPKEQLSKQELLLQWIGLSQLLAATYSLHYQRAHELTSQMRAAGFHGCVLKGIGIAQLYPNPESRQCGDIAV